MFPCGLLVRTEQAAIEPSHPDIMTSPGYFKLFNSEDIPSDLIAPILEQLVDRRDLSQCALVSWTFNRAATPLLYRTLDSRIRRVVGRVPLFGMKMWIITLQSLYYDSQDGVERSIAHPSRILLQKPSYTKYVHHVRETGKGVFFKQLMFI